MVFAACWGLVAYVLEVPGQDPDLHSRAVCYAYVMGSLEEMRVPDGGGSDVVGCRSVAVRSARREG